MPEVLAHRRVPAADRQGGHSRATTTARPDSTGRRASSVDAAGNEVYVADGFGNHRVVVFDAAHRRATSGTGRAATGDAPFSDGELRQDREGRHRLRLRSRQQPRRRHSTRPASSSRAASSRRPPRAPARCGTSRSRATRSSASSTSPTATIRKCSSCGATRWRPWAASATAAAIPARSTASAASRSTRRATSTRARTLEGKRVQKFLLKGGRTMNAPHADRHLLVRRPAGGAGASSNARLERAVSRRQGHRHGAALRGRSAVAQAAAQSLGPRPGDRPHRSIDQDHVWIVHRDNLLGVNEAAAEPEPADRLVLRQGAARPRIRSRRHRRRTTGAGRAEGYDWPESNHGITIDYKGNVWIGGQRRHRRARCSSSRRPASSSMQYGKPGQNKGSNDTENFGRPAKIFVDAKNQRGLHRRRLRQQARRRHRRRHRQVQALLGRTRQQARRHQLRYLRSRSCRRSSSSARPCTARSSRTTGWSTCAIGRTIASRSSSRTARS